MGVFGTTTEEYRGRVSMVGCMTLPGSVTLGDALTFPYTRRLPAERKAVIYDIIPEGDGETRSVSVHAEFEGDIPQGSTVTLVEASSRFLGYIMTERYLLVGENRIGVIDSWLQQGRDLCI